MPMDPNEKTEPMRSLVLYSLYRKDEPDVELLVGLNGTILYKKDNTPVTQVFIAADQYHKYVCVNNRCYPVTYLVARAFYTDSTCPWVTYDTDSEYVEAILMYRDASESDTLKLFSPNIYVETATNLYSVSVDRRRISIRDIHNTRIDPVIFISCVLKDKEAGLDAATIERLDSVCPSSDERNTTQKFADLLGCQLNEYGRL